MQSEMAAMSSCSVLLGLISMGDIQVVYAIEGRALLGRTRPSCEKSQRSRGGDIKETNCLVYDSHLIYSFVNVLFRFKEPLW